MPMPVREPISEPQPQMNFFDERKNLIGGGRREEKPSFVEEIDNDEIPISKSFFVVKRKSVEEPQGD